jgi:hypothetical protein
MQLYFYSVSRSSEFCATTLCVASQRAFIAVVYFVIDSVRKVLVIISYFLQVFRLKRFAFLIGPMRATRPANLIFLTDDKDRSSGLGGRLTTSHRKKINILRNITL